MESVDIILNPAAGAGRAGRLAPRILEHLKGVGLEATIHRTEGPGHGVSLARDLTEAGSRTIAIAGGDGTLFEVVNGCMQSSGPLPDLAIIPVGTGNDFAKSLGLPSDWADASDRIMLGTRRRIDIGQCNDIFFANSLGIGLDADVADLAERRRWIPGNGAYLAALLQSLMRGRKTHVRVSHDSGQLDQDVTLMIFANGCYEGGRFNLAPLADLADGKLDLIVTPGLTRRQIIGFAPRATEGDVDGIPGYQRILVRRASVLLSAPVTVHADGEIIYRNARRLEMGVLPGALRFLS